MPYGGGGGGSGGGSGSGGGTAGGIAGSQGGSRAYSIKFLGNRGVFGGGYPYNNIMEYITIATAGNVTDFGDLTAEKGDWHGCHPSGD